MYEKREKKSGEPEKNLTPLADLGEFGLIDRLTRDIVIKNPSTLKGVGDDAAVIDMNGKLLLLSTDSSGGRDPF